MKAVRQIIGIYNADGGLLGELTYVFKKVTGSAKCDLCTLTHHSVSEKKEWAEFVKGSPIKITTVHLNEQSGVHEGLPQFTAGKVPCIVKIDHDGHISELVSAQKLS